MLYCLFFEMEVKVIMVHLLKTYTVSLCEDYKLEAMQMVTLRPKHGVQCTLVPKQK